MLLTPALAISALGLLIWAVGLRMGFKGIAVIGAVLVVGVGATVLTTGLQHEAGKTEEQINSSTTTISVQTEPVQLISSFDAGLVLSLLGGAMTLQGLSFEP